MSSVSSVRPSNRWISGSVLCGITGLSDCLSALSSGAISLYIISTGDPRESISGPLILVLVVLLVPQIFGLFKAYSPETQSGFVQRGSLLKAWAAVMLCVAGLDLVHSSKDPALGPWLALWFPLGFGTLLITRSGIEQAIRRLYLHGDFTRRLVIVGSGDRALALARHFHDHADGSVRLIGILQDEPVEASSEVSAIPILGAVEDLAHIAQAYSIDAVAVALPWHAEDRLIAWVKQLRTLPVDVLLCPPRSADLRAKCGVSYLGGMPFLRVSEPPLSGWSYIAKAVEDRFLAIVLLVVFGPLMLSIALLIVLDSRGPILFRQKRYGFNNSIIEVLKFRTMMVNHGQADAVSVLQATRRDPRVTRVGRWLRRTSLDELPQLVNVLRGDMSLVGPRPHAVAHNEQYSRIIDAYLARHRVKPGITGWAQINGYRGETDTLEKMQNRVQCDLYYIEHWSLPFDLYILLKTIAVGFVHRNAY
jgi:Undecaprenyl-phosphate glucose phosphotransferase